MTKQSRPLGLSGQYFDLGQAWVLGLALCLILGRPILSAQAADPMGENQLTRIDLLIPQEGIQTLRQSYFHRRMPSMSYRPKTKGVAIIEGNRFEEVAIKLKGAAGSFRPIDDKPAFTINLDTHIEDQSYQGYDKFYLNNSVQDRSYCNEVICRELFNQADIPTPRAAHAWVTLNGRPLGLYVMIEGFNKPWLKRHFEDVSGNLYDGGFLNDIHEDLAVNNGDEPDNHSAKQALVNAFYERDLTRLLPAVQAHMNVEQLLTHTALDVMTWNWDGYAMKPNNYRLYHNRDTDQFQLIPHGMDQMFENPYGELFPRFRGLMVGSLMRLPEIRQRYFTRMNELFSSTFDANRLVRRIDELTSLVQLPLNQMAPQEAARQAEEASQLKQNILERAKYLSFQLSAPSRALRFPPDRQLPVEEWESSRWRGDVVLKEMNQGQQAMLVLEGGQEWSLGRWISSQLLAQGMYRLEARVRCQGLVPHPSDRNGGFRLRAGGAKPSATMLGTRGWTPLAVPFAVEVPAEQVELACEFRAIQGTVWIDRASLILVKLR